MSAPKSDEDYDVTTLQQIWPVVARAWRDRRRRPSEWRLSSTTSSGSGIASRMSYGRR
jgi:hypothetical protein